MSLHVYYLDDEGWVVAESPEDAAKVYADAGFEMAEECDGEWEKRPDDKMLTMHESAPDGGDETKTCAEWAAGGRRYLGSANH